MLHRAHVRGPLRANYFHGSIIARFGKARGQGGSLRLGLFEHVSVGKDIDGKTAASVLIDDHAVIPRVVLLR